MAEFKSGLSEAFYGIYGESIQLPNFLWSKKASIFIPAFWVTGEEWEAEKLLGSVLIQASYRVQAKESKTRRQCLLRAFTMLQTLVTSFKKITASSQSCAFQRGSGSEGFCGSLPGQQLPSLWVFHWLPLDREKAGGWILWGQVQTVNSSRLQAAEKLGAENGHTNHKC